VSRDGPKVVADDGADRPPGPIDLLLHALALYRDLAQFVRAHWFPHDLGFWRASPAGGSHKQTEPKWPKRQGTARRGATVDALTIDGTGLLDRASGSITVSGSVTCSEPATVVVSIGTEQRRGQGVAEAEVPCSDTPSTWSLTVPRFSGRFVPGRAQVSAQAGLCSLLVCDIEEACASIQVRA
jgi:hypothetical protein